MSASAEGAIRVQSEPAERSRSRGYRQGRCEGCALPIELCACDVFKTIDNSVEVNIVVHWRELNKPTNTARLLVRMLSRCRLLVRGGPSSELGRGVDRQLCELASSSALLYPREDARPLSNDDRGAITQLVVPDGTWSQTRRLVRRHTALQHLPAIRVEAGVSRYVLRRGVRQDTCCTLEAVAAALAVLDDARHAQELLAAMASWQKRVLTLRGKMMWSP